MSLLSITEIAEKSNLPERTIHYYHDCFPDYIPHIEEEKRRRYPLEAIAVLHTISKGFSKKKTTEQVEEELKALFPFSIKYERHTAKSPRGDPWKIKEPYPSNVVNLMSEQNQAIHRITETMKERIEKRDELQKLSSTEKRKTHEKMRADMREESDPDTDIVVKIRDILQEKKRRRPWWKKLF